MQLPSLLGHHHLKPDDAHVLFSESTRDLFVLFGSFILCDILGALYLEYQYKEETLKQVLERKKAHILM